MKVAEFVRRHVNRAPNLAWLLGAGASASAGAPTASSMIWDFKRLLYCTNQGVPVRRLPDLSDEATRNELQRYFDGLGDFPARDSDDEYAVYFERVHPAAQDRQRYIERAIEGVSPSFGHRALGALVKLGRVGVVATTNFDRTFEDALVEHLGSTAAFTVASLDNATHAPHALGGHKPLYIKLHGDFQSQRLKNTTTELRAQDEALRRVLIDLCRRAGLCVIGYSGRDSSVMDALEEALDSGKGYPQGLFWCCRADSPRLSRVVALVNSAQKLGIDAAIVEVETFDELMADVLDSEPTLPPELDAMLRRRESRRVASTTPPRPRANGWPVLRCNALPITKLPEVVRRVACSIGGTADVRAAIEKAQARVLACRSKGGVLAFGTDDQVRAAFEPCGIDEFDLKTVEPSRLAKDTAEQGLLLEALYAALERERPLIPRGSRRHAMLVPDDARVADAAFHALRSATRSIAGRIPGTDLRWAEGLSLRLEHRAGTSWVLLKTGIWIQLHTPSAATPLEATAVAANEKAKEFRRERLATRYNKQASAVLEGWLAVIGRGAPQVALSAFGLDAGVDARFSLSTTTAFSRPGVSP